MGPMSRRGHVAWTTPCQPAI